ncbi:protein disulfide-isomerase tmx3 [Anaeramoeba flamelloides]|uniref:Protein disulfide-isomerase tmx3 n=1 Tax=Anaeramoeba flamelloides TaxID=1746091 RepID=A0ABQ8X9J0_9EUKA|nr:protein disulfide-isomerase tmx3 [Anaeramoeba flamelloides]
MNCLLWTVFLSLITLAFTTQKLEKSDGIVTGSDTVSDIDSENESDLEKAKISITKLDLTTFDDYVTHDTMWFIMFQTNWCYHCQQYQKHFKYISKKFSSKAPDLQYGTVECLENELLCDRFNISSYPTLMFFTRSNWIEYEGFRQTKSVLSFLSQVTRPLFKQITTEQAEPIQQLVANEKTHFVYLLQDNYLKEERIVSTLRKLEDYLQIYRNIVTFSCMSYSDYLLLKPTNPMKSIFQNELPNKKNNSMFFAIRGESAINVLTLDVFSLFNDNNNEKINKNNNKKNKLINNKEFDADNGFNLELKIKFLNFIENNLLTLLPQFQTETFRGIISRQRPVVIVIFDFDFTTNIDAHEKYLSELKKISFVDNRFSFCWMDGYYWIQYAERFEIEVDKLPQLVIIDYEKDQFFKPKKFTPSSSLSKNINDFLNSIKINDPKFKGKKSSSFSDDQKTKSKFEKIIQFILNYLNIYIYIFVIFSVLYITRKVYTILKNKKFIIKPKIE